MAAWSVKKYRINLTIFRNIWDSIILKADENIIGEIRHFAGTIQIDKVHYGFEGELT